MGQLIVTIVFDNLNETSSDNKVSSIRSKISEIAGANVASAVFTQNK